MTLYTRSIPRKLGHGLAHCMRRGQKVDAASGTQAPRARQCIKTAWRSGGVRGHKAVPVTCAGNQAFGNHQMTAAMLRGSPCFPMSRVQQSLSYRACFVLHAVLVGRPCLACHPNKVQTNTNN